MDEKSGKQKRKASKTKNEMFREMVKDYAYKCRFDYVLADSWFSSVENMQAIKGELNIDFIFALKSNRKVALSKADKENKLYINIESLQPGQQTVEVWLEELDFPLLLIKQVFKNEDDTVGELYLACSDLNLSYKQITTIYKKRWGVEEYHKSIKSNTGFAKSPTKNIKTQTNHFILSIVDYVKTGMAQTKNRNKSFCYEEQILSGCPAGCLQRAYKLINT